MIKLTLKDPAIRALIIETLLDKVDNDRTTLLSQDAPVGQAKSPTPGRVKIPHLLTV